MTATYDPGEAERLVREATQLVEGIRALDRAALSDAERAMLESLLYAT